MIVFPSANHPGSSRVVSGFRADLEPATPDLTINVSDALAALTGFAGFLYPFSVTNPSPCGG